MDRIADDGRIWVWWFLAGVGIGQGTQIVGELGWIEALSVEVAICRCGIESARGLLVARRRNFVERLMWRGRCMGVARELCGRMGRRPGRRGIFLRRGWRRVGPTRQGALCLVAGAAAIVLIVGGWPVVVAVGIVAVGRVGRAA